MHQCIVCEKLILLQNSSRIILLLLTTLLSFKLVSRCQFLNWYWKRSNGCKTQLEIYDAALFYFKPFSHIFFHKNFFINVQYVLSKHFFWIKRNFSIWKFSQFNFSNVKKIGQTTSKKDTITSARKIFEHSKHVKYMCV